MPSLSATSHSCRTCRCDQELRFVDEDAVELAPLQLVGDRFEQVDALVINLRRRRQGDPRADDAGARAIVQPRGPQHRLHAALAIIVIGLQQGGRFPRVHRRIIEIELGHRALLSASARGRPLPLLAAFQIALDCVHRRIAPRDITGPCRRCEDVRREAGNAQVVAIVLRRAGLGREAVRAIREVNVETGVGQDDVPPSAQKSSASPTGSPTIFTGRACRSSAAATIPAEKVERPVMT